MEDNTQPSDIGYIYRRRKSEDIDVCVFVNTHTFDCSKQVEVLAISCGCALVRINVQYLGDSEVAVLIFEAGQFILLIRPHTTLFLPNSS